MKHPVLDHGYVELLDVMGSDARIVAAARISYDSETKGEERDRKLIAYLLAHQHWSPFEQAQVTYRIKAPIFVLRQLMRYRSGHWNEVSLRYTDKAEQLEMYVPTTWRSQDSKNKQSSVEGGVDDTVATTTYQDALARVQDAYRMLLKEGVAREMARMILPVSTYSEVMLTIDVRNLLNLFHQRIHEGAQWETQQIAIAMRETLKATGKFDWTFEAYG